jgi:hypothetical protein
VGLGFGETEPITTVEPPAGMAGQNALSMFCLSWTHIRRDRPPCH